jgi:DNA-binding NtrC family response regulator
VNRTASVAQPALLIASADARPDLTALLHARGYAAVPVDDVETLQDVRDTVTLCLIDLSRNGEAIRAARAVRTRHPQAIIIGIADPAHPALSADAIRAGVFDVLPRPPSERDLEALLVNAREQATLSDTPAPRAHTSETYGIVGTSTSMRHVMELVQRAASGRCGILICGERGTGREMVARAIHAHDPNPAAPFVKVDYTGLAAEDIELQLFGVINRSSAHGSPDRRVLERVGTRCHLLDADGGILFFENAMELPARVQARLVRILRDREVFVNDSREPRPLDVRPIAAVDNSVEAAVDEGRLRPDLFERLSLIRVDVPALRQRREDIPVLAMHFLKELCRANGTPIKTFTRPALTLLAALPWRGNAPELRSLLERLILLVPRGLVRLEDVLAHTQLDSGSISPTGIDATLRQARARFERDYIATVLQHHHGRIAEAARVLGIQRTNLYRKMRRLNLVRGQSGRES